MITSQLVVSHQSFVEVNEITKGGGGGGGRRSRERGGGLIMGGLYMSPWFQCDADAASKVSDSVAMDTLKL